MKKNLYDFNKLYKMLQIYIFVLFSTYELLWVKFSEKSIKINSLIYVCFISLAFLMYVNTTLTRKLKISKKEKLIWNIIHSSTYIIFTLNIQLAILVFIILRLLNYKKNFIVYITMFIMLSSMNPLNINDLYLLQFTFVSMHYYIFKITKNSYIYLIISSILCLYNYSLLTNFSNILTGMLALSIYMLIINLNKFMIINKSYKIAVTSFFIVGLLVVLMSYSFFSFSYINIFTEITAFTIILLTAYIYTIINIFTILFSNIINLIVFKITSYKNLLLKLIFVVIKFINLQMIHFIVKIRHLWRLIINIWIHERTSFLIN